MATPKILKRMMYKGKDYALVGYGMVSAKAKPVKKDSKGKYVLFDGKKVRL